MTTSIEFYKWCDNQRNVAIEMCGNDVTLIERIKKMQNPIAENLKYENGYMEAPGFFADALFKRAVCDTSYDEAMTNLDKEGKLYA